MPAVVTTASWLVLWGDMSWLMATAPHQAPLTVIAFTTAFAAVAAGVWNGPVVPSARSRPP
jgi:hypothetical protein